MEFGGWFLQKESGKPLYLQLYGYLVAEIRAGQLQAGQRLPGRRTAAAELAVSVNTVDAAYQMLAAEGYVRPKARSGFVVASLEHLVPPPAHSTGDAAKRAADARGAAHSAAPGHKAVEPVWRYSLATGDIDPSLFPGKTWNRLFREVLAAEPGLFQLGEAQGEQTLRQAVAEYLRSYRGVRCTADQLVVGAGLEVLTGMLARLYPGQRVAVENPGYPKTARVLRNMGAVVCPLPVDEEGMRPEALAQSGARLAYLTPSHQFPTGGVMPVGRRARLLRWASRTDGLLIEDDYDSEFRFDGRPLPSLQGLDEEGRVVYAGTFSRSLAPGLRAAYLVLPPALMARWQQQYGGYACTVWRPEQHTLARFMQQGHFSRSLNRMRLAYRQRRGALLAALEEALPPGSYQVENAHTGLYLVLRMPGQDALAVASAAREKGVRVRALEEYRMSTDAEGSGEGGDRAQQPAEATAPEPEERAPAEWRDALVVGYGGLPVQDAAKAVALLAACLE